MAAGSSMLTKSRFAFTRAGSTPNRKAMRSSRDRQVLALREWSTGLCQQTNGFGVSLLRSLRLGQTADECHRVRLNAGSNWNGLNRSVTRRLV